MSEMIEFIDNRVNDTIAQFEEVLALNIYGSKTLFKNEIAYYKRLRRAVGNHGRDGDIRTVRMVAGLWREHQDYKQEWPDDS
jgi:hypothetical protein